MCHVRTSLVNIYIAICSNTRRHILHASWAQSKCCLQSSWAQHDCSEQLTCHTAWTWLKFSRLLTVCAEDTVSSVCVSLLQLNRWVDSHYTISRLLTSISGHCFAVCTSRHKGTSALSGLVYVAPWSSWYRRIWPVTFSWSVLAFTAWSSGCIFPQGRMRQRYQQ